ncbi:MAG: AMP-binding protein [Candidatus Binatia bacterium]
MSRYLIHAPERDYHLDELVLADVLRERASTHRTKPFLRFDDGEITFGEVHEVSSRLARGFASLGVGRRDHVAVMLPNSPDFVHVIFALAKLGAVVVPVNTAYKGNVLEHVLNTADVKTLVVDESFLDCVADVLPRVGGVSRVVIRTAGDPPSPHPGSVELRRLLDHRDEDPHVDVAFSDLHAIMYTSGTTGPSKGVMTPHALALSCALDSLRYVNGWGKNYFCPLPLFHAAGLWDGVMAALFSGTPIGIVERFSASRFWDDVRRFSANVSMSVFSMIPILLNQPPTPGDKDHPLESFYMGKSALDDQMRERFGVRSVETYTSTEAGIPIASPYGTWRVGSCGLEHSERFAVAVVDEHDREVEPGESGEIVVRPRQPFVMMTGYYGFWEATTHIFRNMWFHTGDRAYRDEEGYFYFLDRMKDAIRRRGENISAFDLECAVNLHPAVLESAAIGVPSDLEEEEVKMVVVRRPGATLDPEEIVEHCAERLPGFMVPRYVEITDELLPRTHTDKVAKRRLREMGRRGLTSSTWDRETVHTEPTQASGRAGARSEAI